MRTLTITIPGTPDAVLSPNSRAHWAKKIKSRREIAHSARYATIEAVHALGDGYLFSVDPGSFYDVKIKIAWGKRRRALDGDNALASCKNLIDAVAQAMEVDDRYFKFFPVEQKRDAAGVGYVVVEVTG